MRAEGIFDVDANTSIDQLSEDLNIKMPEVCFPFSTKQSIIGPEYKGLVHMLRLKYRNLILLVCCISLTIEPGLSWNGFFS